MNWPSWIIAAAVYFFRILVLLISSATMIEALSLAKTAFLLSRRKPRKRLLKSRLPKSMTVQLQQIRVDELAANAARNQLRSAKISID